MNELIQELFEHSTETAFPRDGKTASLSPDNIIAFANAIVQQCAGLNFRHEIGLTSDQDFEISDLIKAQMVGK